MVDYDKINNEIQADYFGGFLVYFVGYLVFDNWVAIFDKIYKIYFFLEVDSMGVYFSLNDCKVLA